MLRYRKIVYCASIVFLVALFYAAKYFYHQRKSDVLSLSQQTGTVPNIVARVGEYQIGKLTGWTSPFAEVSLTGQALARKTIATEVGFFSFEQIPVRKDYGELCLTSQDVNQLPGSPVCLAPPPPSNNIEIRDVLLAPTISVAGARIAYGTTAKASGMTYPDSSVQVYLFSDTGFLVRNILPLAAIKLSPKIVYALGLPVYTVTSNHNGYFEFNLPTTNLSDNRIYVTSLFNTALTKDLTEILDQASSPKSFTLVFGIYKDSTFLILFLLLLVASIVALLSKKRKSVRSLIPYSPVCLTTLAGPKILKY